MDTSIYLFTFLAIIITYFLLQQTKKQQSVTVNAKGEKVRRAAYHTEIVEKTDGISTLYESWEYVTTIVDWGDWGCTQI